MKRALVAIVIAVSLSACATIGSDFDESAVSNIHKGQTTEQALISYFGEPSSRSVDSDGNTILVWSYSHAVAFGKAQGKGLIVKLSNGTVVNYSLSKTAN